MESISAIAYLLAILLIVVGLVWLIVVIFQDNVGWAVISLWIFPLIYVYVINNWSRSKIPFLIHVAGIVLMLIQINFLPELPLE